MAEVGPDAEVDSSVGATRRSRGQLPFDVGRGFLIGTAELVPGVSGGTVALVTGVYDQLIDSAHHVVSALRRLVTGPDRLASARAELRRTDWFLIVPVLLGMVTAVLSIAGVMSSFVTEQPEAARGLFFGLVAISVLVPVRMLPPGHRSRWFELALVVVVAVATFWLVGLAGRGAEAEPSLLVVFAAAAVAICALVVPGVSGSFFLLTIGLYTVTLDAIHDRDLGYLAVFGLGAFVGLASFVQLLNYLLTHRRRITLLVMIALMLGSLRALWPWQSVPRTAADGEAHGPGALLAPYDPLAVPVLLALLGAAVVAVLIAVESRRTHVATRG